MIAGGLVAAVGLVGAWAGWTAGNAIEPDQARAAATVSLRPPPTPPAAIATAPEAAVLDAPVRQATRPNVAVVPVKRAHPAPEVPPSEPRQFDVAIPDTTPEPAIAAATETPPKAVPASMPLPLPSSVVARTIEKIGYRCGSVASTSDGGAPGVFKVTCTSGHSYRASPVHGRYRFKRLGG
jgi:hypothetical protein